MTWRVGSHYGIHVYEDQRPVATFFRQEDARRCVNAVNGVTVPRELFERVVAALRRDIWTELAAELRAIGGRKT